MSVGQRKVFVEGIFADPIVRKVGTANTATHTIEQVVGSLCHRVVQGVNQTFEFDPADALDPKVCKTRIYPPAAQQNLQKPIGEVFSRLDDTTMTVLIEPAENQKAAIANNLSGKSTSLRAMETMLSQIQSQMLDLNTTVKKLNADNKKLTGDVKKLLTDNLVQEEEIKNLKASSKKLKEDHGKDIGKLERQYWQLHKDTFKKSDEDRKDLESQNVRLTERVDTLQIQNEEMTKQLSLHTRCFKTLVPLHLRVLLDLAYDLIIAKLNIKDWDKFLQDRTFDEAVDEIYVGLATHKNQPSRKAVQYLCTFNEICRRRNVAAHTATKKEIARAYHVWEGEEERGFVAEIYCFRFDEDICSVPLD